MTVTATVTAAGRITSVAIPATSDIARFYPATDLADAFAIDLPAGTTTSPEVLARFIFSHQAPWVAALMTLRDALVASFGLKTSKQLRKSVDKAAPPRVGIFKVYSANAQEIVLGEDDRHLDFRASVLRSVIAGSAGEQRLVLSTVVRCHNRLGRFYIFVIAPFHRLVVRASLRRASRMGWPLASQEPAR
jgi:Protein of unknown function (DUF2867)